MQYFKRNFLRGRRFRDNLDFNQQLQEWLVGAIKTLPLLQPVKVRWIDRPRNRHR